MPPRHCIASIIMLPSEWVRGRIFSFFQFMCFILILAVGFYPHRFTTLQPHLFVTCMKICIYMQLFNIIHFYEFLNLHTVYKLTERSQNVLRGRQFQGEITNRDISSISQGKYPIFNCNIQLQEQIGRVGTHCV